MLLYALFLKFSLGNYSCYNADKYLPNITDLERGLMKLIKGILMFLGLVFIGVMIFGFFVFQNISSRNEKYQQTPVEETSQTQTVADNAVEIALSQESVNKIIKNYIASMPNNNSELGLEWKDSKVVANLTVPFNGVSVPAQVNTNPVVEAQNLRLDIESIHLSGLPIPTEEAYQMMVSNLTLPSGFNYVPNKRSIHVDLATLLNFPEGIQVQASSIDQEKKLLNVLMSQ